MRHITLAAVWLPLRSLLLVAWTLGLSTTALAVVEPPTAAPDLRNSYATLNAVPGIPDGFKVNFDDAQVMLRSITVEPTAVPVSGSCRVLVRINNLLAKVLKWEPPGSIVGIVEPPTTIPAQTWQALLGRAGVVEPPSTIVFTPADGLTISLEAVSADPKDSACKANVLVLGSVYSDALAGQVTPIDPDDLRSEFIHLTATPDQPGEQTLGFADPQVLVQSFDVIPTQSSASGRCVITARINELLARIQHVEPPSTIAGIDQPPSAIVFTPNDTLKVVLASVPTGKDKDKDGTCGADVLVLGTVADGQ